MSHVWVKCKDCEGINEVRFDGENPSMCPDCRTVDNFDDIESEFSEASER